MNALPHFLRQPLQCGGWTNLLLLVGTFGSVPFVIAGIGPADSSTPITLGLAVAAICTLFWSLLGTGRLAALLWQARQLRLPGLGRQTAMLALGTLLLTVVVPTLVHTSLGSALPQTLAVLWLATALGLFWVSMPPWLIWPSIVLSAALRWLPDPVWQLADILVTPQGMAAAGIVLAALSAFFWWIPLRRGAPAGPWSTPLALTVGQSLGSVATTTGGTSTGMPLFGGKQNLGGLAAAPMRALAVALGPGFGLASPHSLLATHGPTVAVAAFWLLLGNGNDDATNGAQHIGLVFAPVMVLATALAPLMRLETLFRRPAMGLHELALTPGLPSPAAPALMQVLLRQLLGRAAGGLLVMTGFALAVGAAPGYYPVLLTTSLCGLLLIGGCALLSVSAPRLRPLLVVMMIAVTLSIFTSMLPTVRGTPPAWLLTAWLAGGLLAVLPWCLSLARLRDRPHPWLQN